jgi:hypothetical protein
MRKSMNFFRLFSLTAILLSANVLTPSMSQSREVQEYPTQVGTLYGTVLELNICKRQSKYSVRCTFTGTVSQDGYFVIYPVNSKIIDPQGNEYLVNRIQSGKTLTAGNTEFKLSMVQNVKYLINIDFPGIPESVNKITLLKLAGFNNSTLDMRELPIVNRDGIFIEIPPTPKKPVGSSTNPQPETSTEIAPTPKNPVGSSNNSQPQTSNTPIIKICLPFMNCR